MDREKLQSFIRTAGTGLSRVRNSLLIVAQTGDASDLAASRSNLDRLRSEASGIGLTMVAHLAAECEAALQRLAEDKKVSPNTAYATLDAVARIEAAVWDIPLHDDDFLIDVAGFIDASFEELLPLTAIDGPVVEQFEIDEETFDIFRSEAEELLANIANDLRVLTTSPGDKEALWDIRRNAHTFKGAAGIVGLKDASEIAHRMENLLDRLVEMRREAVPQVVEFLDASAGRLGAIVAAKSVDEDSNFDSRYANVMAWLSSSVVTNGGIPANLGAPPDPAAPATVHNLKTTATPVVRVSLDRLDELIKISRSLLINRSAITTRFSKLSPGVDNDADALAKLELLFEEQRQLAEEIQAKLLRIRMVKFGTLETRLSRSVNMTAQDECKKAVVEIENGDVEIDTQIIDALIEPLLHLIKNAVVHGIEPPETRRLMGKPEKGSIRVRLEADEEALILSVADDGSGISASKLKTKAIANGLIDAGSAASMSDRDALKLIFDRGLTTAEKVDLNAGRGVGMSIVKESVEVRGGTVLVESEPQRGTTFTILMPLAIAKPEPALPERVAPHDEPAVPLVLIVDDSASVRHRTTKLVEEAGFRVITAGNGVEALELLLSGEWNPDLILSDIEMPQINGWEFLEYVKTNDKFGHIPVVMVTSLDTEGHRRRAFALGAADYVVKPFSEISLEKVLERLGLAAMA